MKFPVHWLEFAENKLDDIYGYYSEKAGQRIATEIVNGIIDATLTLQVQPKIGQVQRSLLRKKAILFSRRDAKPQRQVFQTLHDILSAFATLRGIHF